MAEDQMLPEIANATKSLEQAWDAAAKIGTTVRRGDVADLPAREAADAWDTANRLGKPVKEEDGSGDLLARMTGSATPAPAALENSATVPPVSPIEQKPSVPVTPENQAVPPTVPAETPATTTPGEVPLNPVITVEQKQAEADAERKAKMEADVKTKGETESNEGEAVKQEEYMSKIEKELAEKIAGTRGAGGEALAGGEKRAIARDIYLRELGNYSIQHEPGFRGQLNRFFAPFTSGKENVRVVDDKGEIKKIGKVNWMFQHPDQELVDFLKSELANKPKEKEEEVAPLTESEPVVPPAGDASATEVPEVATPTAKEPSETTPRTDFGINQSTEKQETNEAIKPVNEDIVEETPEEKFKRNCERYGYEGVLGEEFYTLMNKKEKKPVDDPKTGKPFKYKFFIEPNDFFDYLDKKEAEKKQAEVAEAPALTETPISEVNPTIELTQEAKDILEKIEKEKVFMPYVTENLSRILKENGISQEDINKKTPQELMEILKNKKPAETAQASTPTGTPKPEPLAETQKQPVVEIKPPNGNLAEIVQPIVPNEKLDSGIQMEINKRMAEIDGLVGEDYSLANEQVVYSQVDKNQNMLQTLKNMERLDKYEKALRKYIKSPGEADKVIDKIDDEAALKTKVKELELKDKGISLSAADIGKRYFAVLFRDGIIRWLNTQVNAEQKTKVSNI